MSKWVAGDTKNCRLDSPAFSQLNLTEKRPASARITPPNMSNFTSQQTLPKVFGSSPAIKEPWEIKERKLPGQGDSASKARQESLLRRSPLSPINESQYNTALMTSNSPCQPSPAKSPSDCFNVETLSEENANDFNPLLRRSQTKTPTKMLEGIPQAKERQRFKAPQMRCTQQAINTSLVAKNPKEWIRFPSADEPLPTVRQCAIPDKYFSESDYIQACAKAVQEELHFRYM